MKKIFFTGRCIPGFLVGWKEKDGVPAGMLGREKMQAVRGDIMRADIFTNRSVKNGSSNNIAVENAKMQRLIFNT